MLTRSSKLHPVTLPSSAYCSKRSAARILQNKQGMDKDHSNRFLRLCVRQSRGDQDSMKPFVRTRRASGGKSLFHTEDLRSPDLDRRCSREGISIKDAALYLGLPVAKVKAALELELLTEPRVLFDLTPRGAHRGISPNHLEAFSREYTAQDLHDLSADLPLAHQYVMHRTSFDGFGDLPRHEANALDKMGRTALHRAVGFSDNRRVPDMVAGLLKAGCDGKALDAQGRTAGDVLLERMNGHPHPDAHLTLAANVLFDRHEPIDARGEERDDLMSFLIEIDRVQDILQNMVGMDLSYYLLHARSPAMVDALVSLGADVSEDALPICSSPASYAAARGRFDVEQRLIDHGADPMSFDTGTVFDKTPLTSAADRNDVATCLALLKRGANAERARQAVVDSCHSDNEAWAVIMEWEQDVLEKVANEVVGAGWQEVRVRARL